MNEHARTADELKAIVSQMMKDEGLTRADLNDVGIPRTKKLITSVRTEEDMQQLLNKFDLAILRKKGGKLNKGRGYT